MKAVISRFPGSAAMIAEPEKGHPEKTQDATAQFVWFQKQPTKKTGASFSDPLPPSFSLPASAVSLPDAALQV